jgi:hypothetical protein
MAEKPSGGGMDKIGTGAIVRNIFELIMIPIRITQAAVASVLGM